LTPTVGVPLLLGHRGVRARGLNRINANLPVENSLAAFEYALAQGCDGFEFDIRQTRDGRDVIWHDADFRGKQIADTNCADLTDHGGNRLASFPEVLARFGSRAYLDIELKTSGSEEAIVAALKANPPQRGYIFSSFLPDILLRLHDVDGTLPLGLLCEDKQAMNSWRELPVQVFLPRHDLIESGLIEEMHSAGRQVMTWTVNSPRRMRQLAEWGIDGLISDDPQSLYQTFHIA
jgi:glycerophosphoryl diester phosphodiesterase